MKKIIMAYIVSLGGVPHYAGNTIKSTVYPSEVPKEDLGTKVETQMVEVGSKTTMYIEDKKFEIGKQTIEEAILNKFGFSLPFKLQTI